MPVCPQAFYDLQTDPWAHTNLLGNPNNLANLTTPQRTAYLGLTNRMEAWHNPPSAPATTSITSEAGTLTISMPEQLGINYGLLRSQNLSAPNWTLVTNYLRQIHSDEAVVSLTDPTPPPPRAFYRAFALGH